MSVIQLTGKHREAATGICARIQAVMKEIIEVLERDEIDDRLMRLKREYAFLIEKLFQQELPEGSISEGEAVRILAMQKSCMELISQKKEGLLAEMRRCQGTRTCLSAYDERQATWR